MMINEVVRVCAQLLAVATACMCAAGGRVASIELYSLKL